MIFPPSSAVSQQIQIATLCDRVNHQLVWKVKTEAHISEVSLPNFTANGGAGFRGPGRPDCKKLTVLTVSDTVVRVRDTSTY